MNDDILWWSTGQWQAAGTIVLVLITGAYVYITGRLLHHASESAKSAGESALAADRSAAAAEASTRLAVMPFVVVEPQHRKTDARMFDVTNHGIASAVNTAIVIEYSHPDRASVTKSAGVVNLIAKGCSTQAHVSMERTTPPWKVEKTTAKFLDPIGRRYKVVTDCHTTDYVSTAFRKNVETDKWDQFI